jgi:hypothetical protein
MSNNSLAESIFGSTPKSLHLGLSVADLETSERWYCDMLGFSSPRRQRRGKMKAWVAARRMDALVISR